MLVDFPLERIDATRAELVEIVADSGRLVIAQDAASLHDTFSNSSRNISWFA